MSPVGSAGDAEARLLCRLHLADGFEGVPTVVVAGRVKVSLASSILSSLIGVRARTLVAPGAKVAVVAGVRVVPPSGRTLEARAVIDAAAGGGAVAEGEPNRHRRRGRVPPLPPDAER
jgi:hypothetical protein